MLKSFLSILIATFLLLLLTGFLSINIQLHSIFAFIGHFYFTLFFINFFKRKHQPTITILLILGALLTVNFYTIYLYLLGQFGFLPYQIFRLLAVFSAYFYFRFKKPSSLLPFCLSVFFLIFMNYSGWDYWFHFRNFGTFTGKVTTHNLPTKFESFNESKESVTESNFNDKIVLLDFWTTSCGVCFQKFPQLQTVYEKYKQDSSVMILAVDTPLEEDKPNQAFEMIKQRNYAFPVVITKDADLAEKWGVIGYPTTFVINQNGQIVYRGDIEGAIRMVDELKLDK